MSKLRETLAAGKFALVAELMLPKGVAVDQIVEPVKILQDRATAFGVPDNAHARMRLSALAAACLVRQAGGEPLLHLTCRDRNRLALESDLLGAGALGLENLLLVSGDYVTLGDHPQAKPVYDADSVQLLQIAQGMMAGHDSMGLPLQGNPTFFLGAVVIPEAEPLAPQLLKFRKKVAAGAQFFVTSPIFDLDKLRAFVKTSPEYPVHILGGVKVLDAAEIAQSLAGSWRQVYSLPPGVVQELAGKDPEETLIKGAEVAGRVLKQLKEEKLVHGVYVKAKGRADLLDRVLKTAGL